MLVYEINQNCVDSCFLKFIYFLPLYTSPNIHTLYPCSPSVETGGIEEEEDVTQDMELQQDESAYDSHFSSG